MCVYDLQLPEKLYSEVSVVVPIIKGVKVFNDEYVRRSCVSVQRMSSRYIYTSSSLISLATATLLPTTPKDIYVNIH